MLDWLQHFDKHLPELVNQYGTWVYGILAAVIFLETAVVIFPFLPGDSLLFAVGLVAADQERGLSILGMFLILTTAAILGNVVNYWLGRFFGKRLFANPKAKFFSPANLAKTHGFFETYGGKAIILTRFVPVIRAFAPFVAGMGAMEFPTFMIFNTIGGAAWVVVCLFAGVFLGGIPVVKQHFDFVMLAVVGLSVVWFVFEFAMHKRREKKKKAAELLANQQAAGDSANTKS